MKIQVFKNIIGWVFSIRSRNGRTLCQSGAYSSKQKCIKSAALICDDMIHGELVVMK